MRKAIRKSTNEEFAVKFIDKSYINLSQSNLFKEKTSKMIDLLALQTEVEILIQVKTLFYMNLPVLD